MPWTRKRDIVGLITTVASPHGDRAMLRVADAGCVVPGCASFKVSQGRFRAVVITKRGKCHPGRWSELDFAFVVPLQAGLWSHPFALDDLSFVDFYRSFIFASVVDTRRKKPGGITFGSDCWRDPVSEYHH